MLRTWICPAPRCPYSSENARLLRSHLMHAHKLSKEVATQLAGECEFWQRNPFSQEWGPLLKGKQ